MHLLQRRKKNTGKIEFKLNGKNCNISDKFNKLYPKNSNSQDILIMGIMLGGAEFLFKKNLAIKESKCVSKGDKECIFEVYEDDNKEHKILSNLFNKLNINQEKLEKDMNLVYIKRPSKGSFVNAKKIQFGDGNFTFSGLKGVVIASRVMSPLFPLCVLCG